MPPEAILPFIYGTIELMVSVFPKNIPDLVSAVKLSGSNQLGVYTEGYRNCLRVISRSEISGLASQRNSLNHHIVEKPRYYRCGKSHELVPELLL